MTQARAAVIGAGLMGYWHARALSGAGAILALVIDPDKHKAQRLASRYRGCVAASSLVDLSTHAITVAHVCTPTPSHAAAIEAALSAGCHVLVEKPLAEDEATTRQLLSLAESRRRLLCPVHQVLFQRGVRQTLAALDRIGPRHVDLVMCSAGAQQRIDADDDLVAEILPHPLSFVARTLPEAVRSGQWTIAVPGPGELRATLASQVGTVCVLISTHGRPTMNAARIIGEHGTIHLDFFHGFAMVEGGAVSRTRKALQPLVHSARLGMVAALNLAGRAIKGQTAYPGLWELVSAFYRDLEGEGRPIPTEEVIRVAAMRDAILNARAAVSRRV